VFAASEEANGAHHFTTGVAHAGQSQNKPGNGVPGEGAAVVLVNKEKT
jgi:hypothetical protein